MPAKVILVDIDHTLSYAEWRDALINEENWDYYHSKSIDDKPILEMCELIFSLQLAGWTVIALTTRPAKWRTLTNEWMLKHGVFIDEILMRPDNDYRPTPELKLALARERFPRLAEEVAFVIDDRDDVADAFKFVGVSVLQMHARRTQK